MLTKQDETRQNQEEAHKKHQMTPRSQPATTATPSSTPGSPAGGRIPPRGETTEVRSTCGSLHRPQVLLPEATLGPKEVPPEAQVDQELGTQGLSNDARIRLGGCLRGVEEIIRRGAQVKHETHGVEEDSTAQQVAAKPTQLGHQEGAVGMPNEQRLRVSMLSQHRLHCLHGLNQRLRFVVHARVFLHNQREEHNQKKANKRDHTRKQCQ